jgi:segregation and condensation protein A
MLDDPQLPQATAPNASGSEPASEPEEGIVIAADQTTPLLKLRIYEGPLDLLLDLIRKQKINIYDIPIARITHQYLEYLRALNEMNIDVAGEFIFMAATLIYIKSRMLLPPDPAAAPEEQEDPRRDLVHRLLEHEQFKNAAQMLQSKRIVEEAAWSQPGLGEFFEAEDEPGLAVSVFDLVAAFREVIERAKKRPPLRVEREEITVASMIEYVRDALLRSPHPVRLDDLMVGFVAKQALIALILALLEMVRIRAILLRQRELFGPITVHRNKRFEEIMSGIDPQALEASFEAIPTYEENGAAGEARASSDALKDPEPKGQG